MSDTGDETLDETGALAGAEVGADELARPVDPGPGFLDGASYDEEDDTGSDDESDQAT